MREGRRGEETIGERREERRGDAREGRRGDMREEGGDKAINYSSCKTRLTKGQSQTFSVCSR